jgi:hypothetical protein
MRITSHQFNKHFPVKPRLIAAEIELAINKAILDSPTARMSDIFKAHGIKPKGK